MRLIDADALLAEYDRQHVGPPGAARKLIEEAPTVDPPKPKRESRAMLPCTCGCRRREHWLTPNGDELRCMRCGRRVAGKNATDVIRNWNGEVSAE